MRDTCPSRGAAVLMLLKGCVDRVNPHVSSHPAEQNREIDNE